MTLVNPRLWWLDGEYPDWVSSQVRGLTFFHVFGWGRHINKLAPPFSSIAFVYFWYFRLLQVNLTSPAATR